MFGFWKKTGVSWKEIENMVGWVSSFLKLGLIDSFTRASNISLNQIRKKYLWLCVYIYIYIIQNTSAYLLSIYIWLIKPLLSLCSPYYSPSKNMSGVRPWIQYLLLTKYHCFSISSTHNGGDKNIQNMIIGVWTEEEEEEGWWFRFDIRQKDLF